MPLQLLHGLSAHCSSWISVFIWMYVRTKQNGSVLLWENINLTILPFFSHAHMYLVYGEKKAAGFFFSSFLK